MLQQMHGTTKQADDFYDRQVHSRLTQGMRSFIACRSMLFLATADGIGHCDATFRAGPPGFVIAVGDHGLTFPEYRGNGVMASMGNLMENPRLGLLFMDFTDDHIGLHVNGQAHVLPDTEQRVQYPHLPIDTAPGRQPTSWVHVTVEEAYVHCSRHIPHLEPALRPRQGSQRPRDSDYFRDEQVRPVPSRPSNSDGTRRHLRLAGGQEVEGRGQKT